MTNKSVLDANERYLVGGVNSPVRAFRSVGLDPIRVSRAEGATVWDSQDRSYVDYIASWGAMILGHATPAVNEALRAGVQNGTSYGLSHAWEGALAEKMIRAFPFAERVRIVNSGTEATMTALRLARAYTHRDLVIKFDGCYHGHADGFLVQAGSGASTLGIPSSAGVPSAVSALTLSLPFNQVDRLMQILEEKGDHVAAIIFEPLPCNMGVVLPQPDFIHEIFQGRKKHGYLIISDEVITGFRVAYGGYSTLKGLEPDLVTLGKIIGGGLPIGAVAGQRKVMDLLAPEGPVYQAGTLSGNPLACRAGLTVLEILEAHPPYEALERYAEKLTTGIQNLARQRKIALHINRFRSLFSLFFTDHAVESYPDVLQTQRETFICFYQKLFSQGILPPPSPFEAWFLTTCHTDKELTQTLQAVERAFQSLYTQST